VLTDFINTDVYNKNRDFLTTISPSMDILVSSNLERLLYLALQGDTEAVRSRMKQLVQTGSYSMPEDAMARIRDTFCGLCADDDTARKAIARVFDSTGYIMDPHTAVAWQAAEDYEAQTGDHTPCVVLSTASPYKFPQSVLEALGRAVPADAQQQTELLAQVSGMQLPSALDGVLSREVRFKDCIDPNEMMNYVLGKAAQK